MPSLFEDSRTGLADTLRAAGLRNVWDHMPTGLTPPGVVILPASDWITPGESFGGFTVALDVVIVAAPGSNARQLADLEARIEQALTACAGNYGIERVSEPYVAEIGESQFLMAALTITN